jgi:type I site-specific restriction-modification system R (restriction) subunit
MKTIIKLENVTDNGIKYSPEPINNEKKIFIYLKDIIKKYYNELYSKYNTNNIIIIQKINSEYKDLKKVLNNIEKEIIKKNIKKKLKKIKINKINNNNLVKIIKNIFDKEIKNINLINNLEKIKNNLKKKNCYNSLKRLFYCQTNYSKIINKYINRIKKYLKKEEEEKKIEIQDNIDSNKLSKKTICNILKIK